MGSACIKEKPENSNVAAECATALERSFAQNKKKSHKKRSKQALRVALTLERTRLHMYTQLQNMQQRYFAWGEKAGSAAISQKSYQSMLGVKLSLPPKIHKIPKYTHYCYGRVQRQIYSHSTHELCYEVKLWMAAATRTGTDTRLNGKLTYNKSIALNEDQVRQYRATDLQFYSRADFFLYRFVFYPHQNIVQQNKEISEVDWRYGQIVRILYPDDLYGFSTIRQIYGNEMDQNIVEQAIRVEIRWQDDFGVESSGVVTTTSVSLSELLLSAQWINQADYCLRLGKVRWLSEYDQERLDVRRIGHKQVLKLILEKFTAEGRVEDGSVLVGGMLLPFEGPDVVRCYDMNGENIIDLSRLATIQRLKSKRWFEM